MVVLTHSTNVTSPYLPFSVSPNKQKSLKREDGGGSDNRRLFNLVAFLVVAAFLTKFIVEFRIQERLKLKLTPRPHKFHRTYRLEEQHEIIEIILNPADSKHANGTHFQNDTLEDSLFQVEVIHPPPVTSLLNISDFKWIRNNASICSENITPFTKLMPVLIHTSRSHFMERKAIRETWASLKNYRDWSIRPVFLIGQTSQGKQNESEEVELDKEHQLYGDVITGSFIDSYRNLTYKHIMGYKWILEHCTNASFVLKVDDDTFVDVVYFIDKIMNGTETRMTSMDERLTIIPESATDLFCYEFKGSGPFRSRNSKWYVSKEEWPEAKYPFYCSGWGYGINLRWMNKIYMMSSQTKYFWVDDVFIGILINMAKSFFNEDGPKVESINHLYTFDDRLYLGMCGEYGTGQNETALANAKRKFGSVVHVERSKEFGRIMECLWRKTLMDKNMFIYN